MYGNIHTRIVIGDFTFHSVNELEIRSSIKTLTDIAKITLPRRFQLQGKLVTDLRDVLPDNEDIPVEIWAGYNGDLELEFRGYVDHYDPRPCLTVWCQDEMYLLKRGTVRRAFQAAKLRDVVNQITAGAYSMQIPDLALGDLLLKDLSPAAALQLLQEQSGIYTYFRPGTTTLVSGFPYDQTYDTHVLHLQKNVKPDHSRLTYEKRDASQYQVTAISNQGNGQKLEVKVPTNSTASNTRTLNFGPLTEAELRRFAEAELKRFTYTGWRGQLSIFGVPRVKPGDIVQITDAAYGRNGNNLVDEVVVRIKPVMYERELTLGPQV